MPRELARLLLHPLILLAIAVWALNDHYLKTAWGNAFTGKLSDVTSLIAGPVLLAALTGLLGIARGRPLWLLAFWSLALAAVMVAIKLWEPAADAYRYGLAAAQWPFRSLLSLELRPLRPVNLTMDPADIWTLPATLVPIWLLLYSPRVRAEPAQAGKPAPQRRAYNGAQRLEASPRQ